MFERLCFVFKKSLLAFLFLGYSSVFAATDQEKLNFRFDTSKMDNCTFIPIYAIKPFGASINFDKGKVQKYRYEGVDFYRVFTNFRKPEEWAADRKQMYKDKYDFPMPKCMYKGVKVDKIAFCFSMMMGGRESTRKKDYMQSKMDKFCISGPDNLTDGNSFNYDEPNNGWTGADLEGDYYANELGFVDGGYHFHWGDKETHGHSLGKRGVKDKDVWTSRVVGQNYYPDKKAKCTVDKGWKSQLIPPDYGRGHKIWMKINRYIPCDYCAENDGIHTSERCCKGTQTNSNSGTSTNVWDSNNKKCCPKGQEWDTATNKCKNTLVCPTPKEGIAIPEGCSCGYGLYEKSGHCCPSYTDWNSSQKKCVSTCKTGPWKDVAFKVSTDMKSCLKEQERTREGCPFSVERTREISAADSDCWSGWGPCEKSKSNENYYQMRLCKSSTKGCWSSGGKKFTDIRECTPCSDSGKGGFGQSVKCDGTCKSGLVKSGDKCGCPSGKKGTAVGGSCTNCPAGKYRNGWTSTARSCSTCPVDKWSAAGASSCTACPSGTSSPAGSDNVKDCIKKIICNGDYIENSGSCYAQCKNLKQNEICFTSKGVSSNKSKHFTLDPKIAFSDYPSVSECFISGAVRYKPSSNVAKDKFNPDIGRRFKLECMPMVPFDDLNEFVDD